MTLNDRQQRDHDALTEVFAYGPAPNLARDNIDIAGSIARAADSRMRMRFLKANLIAHGKRATISQLVKFILAGGTYDVLEA
jgi:hypothetical protein